MSTGPIEYSFASAVPGSASIMITQARTTPTTMDRVTGTRGFAKYRMLPRSQLAEERLEHRRTLFGEYSRSHVEAMIQAMVVVKVVECAECARLWIGGTPDAARDAGLMHEAGTHGAGLKRHVHRAIREPPSLKARRGGANREQFRVTGRVVIDLATIVCASHHRAVADDHRTDRDFA